jgi:hypothetical protein
MRKQTVGVAIEKRGRELCKCERGIGESVK